MTIGKFNGETWFCLDEPQTESRTVTELWNRVGQA